MGPDKRAVFTEMPGPVEVDHHCANALPDICFAAWLCTVVYVEKAVCVYHLWLRSMWSWQLAAGKVVGCDGFTGRRKSQQSKDEECGSSLFLRSRGHVMIVKKSIMVWFTAEQQNCKRLPDIKCVWNVSVFHFSSGHTKRGGFPPFYATAACGRNLVQLSWKFCWKFHLPRWFCIV